MARTVKEITRWILMSENIHRSRYHKLKKILMDSFPIHHTNWEIARPRARLKKARRSEELGEDRSKRTPLRVECRG